MSSEKFHGKTIEEIVDIRFKEWELRKAKEREEQAEIARKYAENKAQVTEPAKPAPPAPAHEHFVAIKKWLHNHHVL